MKTIAFIIVSYNSSKYITSCLDSIVKYAEGLDYEIVVVDNGSSDGSQAIVSSYDSVELVELGKNFGFGVANNIGCKFVLAEHYFILNVDAYFDVFFDFKSVLNLFRADPSIAIVGARLVYPDNSPQTTYFTFSSPVKWILQTIPFYSVMKNSISKSRLLLRISSMISSKAKSYADNLSFKESDYGFFDVDWVSGASMIVSGSYFQKYGLFDENIFLYSEDEDLCITVKKNKFRVVFQNTDPVIHVHGWNSEGKYNPIVTEYKINSLTYFVDKHFGEGVSGFIMKSLLPIYVSGWSDYLRKYHIAGKTFK
jgi:N-acetylglucosaminyl-diphospho-decaprenol L-rhamnosyltransferase